QCSMDVMDNICTKLGNLGSLACPLVIKVFQNGDMPSKENAMWVLFNLGQEAKDVITFLTQQLNNPNRYIRQLAIQSLAKMGPAARQAVSKLRYVKSHDKILSIREMADAALGQITGGKP